MTNVMILFASKGVNKNLANVLCHEISNIANAKVHKVSAEYIRKMQWEGSTKAIVIPGGRDLPYVDELGDLGCRKIKDFVNNGGNYLGICAGAYFACKHVVFAKNSPIEVLGHRKLQFFDGDGVGPIGDMDFAYGSNSGIRAIEVCETISGTPNKVYYNGGPTFLSCNPLDCKVLFYYKNFENSPAIIENNVGEGKAILSGVHFEYCPQKDVNNLKIAKPKIYKQLIVYDSFRRELCKDIFQRICLH